MIGSPYLYRRSHMRLLNFKVDAQKLEKHGDFSGLYPGSAGYLFACFICDSNWTGLVKVAEFRSHIKDDPISVPVINKRCEIPESICAGKYFFVRLIGQRGNVRITTNNCEVRLYG